MQHESKCPWVRDLPWLIVFGLLSSVYCVLAAARIGVTCDEPIYLLRGLESWHLGGSGGLTKIGTMPLPVDVTTLPLYIWELLRGQRFDQLLEIDRMLPVARAGTLVFWWAVLFYGWRVGSSLAGPWGGRLAVALLAFEPSLLAHASLATTDVALTACMLALAYHFREGRTSGWRLRVGFRRSFTDWPCWLKPRRCYWVRYAYWRSNWIDWGANRHSLSRQIAGQRNFLGDSSLDSARLAAT